MKKTIVTLMFAASAFMVSCGNKTTEEVETEGAAVEEATPVIEEAAPEEVEVIEADTTAAE